MNTAAQMQVKPVKGIKEGAEGLLTPKALLPFNKCLPAERVAKLPNTTADSLHFVLSFNQSDHRQLPPGHTEVLGEFEVSGERLLGTAQPVELVISCKPNFYVSRDISFHGNPTHG